MTSPATQPARFATRRRTRQLVPGTETMNESGRCDRHDHLPESSRPPAHASLIADPFDRALEEEATPGHDLQMGRVGQYLANTLRTDGPVDGPDGGVVFVFGQATSAFATEDEVGPVSYTHLTLPTIYSV